VCLLPDQALDMTQANQYRVKAAEFAARAKAETSQKLQVEYAMIAAGYLRLAEQADRNALTDVTYEPPLSSFP
jgi:hypothetical protein